jgi:hypothetical protein
MTGSDTGVSLAEAIDCALYFLACRVMDHMTEPRQNDELAIPEFACKARRLALDRDDTITSSGNNDDRQV